MELGRIGEIQQSSSVVMHIQIDGDDRGSFDLKWRGVALSNFDGRTWSNNREQHPLPPQLDGRFVLPPARRRCPESVFAHRFTTGCLMEPVGMNIFFLAADPESLEGNYRHVAVDDGGGGFRS